MDVGSSQRTFKAQLYLVNCMVFSNCDRHWEVRGWLPKDSPRIVHPQMEVMRCTGAIEKVLRNYSDSWYSYGSIFINLHGG